MALKLDRKKAIVVEVQLEASNALSVVAADYRGLSSPEMTELRKQARKTGVKLRIVRNTLARRAFLGTSYESISDRLTGPVLLAFASKEPSATARLLRDFGKDHDKLRVKVISLGGKIFEKEQLSSVAELPTKDEAVAKLLSVMQAPITKLVRTLAEPQAKLVRTFAALRDDKQAKSA